MPRALPAALRNGGPPPMTSPPLVAGSRSSSVSTLSDEGPKMQAGREDPVSETTSPPPPPSKGWSWHEPEDAVSPRSASRDLPKEKRPEADRVPLPSPGWRTTGAPTIAARRSADFAKPMILNDFPVQPVRHSFRGVFDDDEDARAVRAEAEEQRRASQQPMTTSPAAASSPFLSSMSLHSVGRRSSVTQPPIPASSLSSTSSITSSTSPHPPARQRSSLKTAIPLPEEADSPPLGSPDAVFEKGHRTMLSSGSVRSIGRRTSVNSAASLSPSLRDEAQVSGSPRNRTISDLRLAAESALDGGDSTPSSSSSTAGTTPSPTLAAAIGMTPQSSTSGQQSMPIPSSGDQVHSLLAHLLPPGVVRYPHAPGHDSPHAFEEGCSRVPSPRPTNHYRHDRSGGEWKPGSDAEQAIDELQKDPTAVAGVTMTPTRSKVEELRVTPKRQSSLGQEVELGLSALTDEQETPRATRPPFAPPPLAAVPIEPAALQYLSEARSPTRPAFLPSASSPPDVLPRSAPNGSFAVPPPSTPSSSASMAPLSRTPSPGSPRSRPSSSFPRTASFNFPASCGASTRPSIALAIRERRRQASLFAAAAAAAASREGTSIQGSRNVSGSSSVSDVGENHLPSTTSTPDLTSRTLWSTWGSLQNGSAMAEAPPLSPSASSVRSEPPLPPSGIPQNRRIRSRGPSRMGGLSDLSPNQDFAGFKGGVGGGRVDMDSRAQDSFARALAKGLELGMLGDVVMTPTTEEWHQLGGLPGEMRKFRDDPEGDNDTSSSSDESEDDDRPSHVAAVDGPMEAADGTAKPVSVRPSDLSGALRLSLADRLPLPQPSPPYALRPDEVPTPTQEPPGFLPVTSSLAPTQLHQDPVHGIIESCHPDPDMKSLPMLSAMSTQSVVSVASSSGGESTLSGSSMILPFNTSPKAMRSGVPLCSLLHDGIVQGPVDPRVYSAVTGRRNIDSFVIEGEAGKGAYGMVRRARERGPDGQPIGPDLIIKYIVKQKILADCWKKHRILGPIPIEIHVLDHLRRVPYRPSLIATTTKLHRRPPSRRQSTFGGLTPSGHGPPLGTTAPLQAAYAAGATDPLANGDPRTGHPNICGILDYFEDADYYYMVMPCFGEGQDLFDYVDLAPDGLPLAEVRSMFGQVADAVAFLHEHNIVHRDIKDENVIMDGFGNVQLIDFGSAAYIREGKLFDTFSGTLDFAAPEVLRGERHGGKEIDVWALGVLLYVLICGECPFWSSSEAAQGIERNTRAYKALEAKVRSLNAEIASSSRANEAANGDAPLADDKVNLPIQEEVVRPDDALDLVARCLSIDVRDRPTAHEVCAHRFLVGSSGWVGRPRPAPPVSSDNDSS